MDLSYKKKNKKSSIRQLEVRKKLSLASRFLMPIQSILNETYHTTRKDQPGFAAAMSDLLTYPVIGEYPDLSLDYSKIRISRGNLPSEKLSAVADGEGLKIMWNSGNCSLYPRDEVNVLVYNQTQNGFFFFRKVAWRGDRQANIELPYALLADTIHAYFFLQRAKKCSDSVYLGSFGGGLEISPKP